MRRNELFRRGTGRAVAASEQYIFRIIYVGWQASVQRVWGQRRAELLSYCNRINTEQSRPYSSRVLSAGAGLGGCEARVTRVTCSGHSRTPHPLTHPQHSGKHIATAIRQSLAYAISVTSHHVPVSSPVSVSVTRPCHVSRLGRAPVTLAHVASLSRGLSSRGLCHVSRCDVVTQCCHDYLSPCLSVCYHGLSHTDTGLSVLCGQCR